MDYSPWGHKESDTTERLHSQGLQIKHFSQTFIYHKCLPSTSFLECVKSAFFKLSGEKTEENMNRTEYISAIVFLYHS